MLGAGGPSMPKTEHLIQPISLGAFLCRSVRAKKQRLGSVNGLVLLSSLLLLLFKKSVWLLLLLSDKAPPAAPDSS